MVIRNPIIDEKIKNKIPVRIKGNDYLIESNPKGSCDNCYFIDKTCPKDAVTICCSNGGNILKLIERNENNTL